MGVYLNPGNDMFCETVRGEIYVDKTELIRETNRRLKTSQKFVCISRPRRFGKSMAAYMLAAYYGKDCDSSELFSSYKIATCDSYEKYLNKYNVIMLNIQDFIRLLLKDKAYVALAYMTGILPIKKYATHSNLNMFDEYSMIDAGDFQEFVGFTEEEVRALCEQYQVDFDTMQSWYDGYTFPYVPHVYNPKSVVDSIRRKRFGSYWTRTETYEALKIYIDLNYDGLKEDIIEMLTGQRICIYTGRFQNDMITFKSKDDVLTLLVHLGYLAYDSERSEVFIPNTEIRGEFRNAVTGDGSGTEM